MTPEEKANKYAEEAILTLYSDSELMQDFVQKQKKYAKVDFLAGYNEAMRWRDPIAEKPEIFETVFVKAEKRWEGRSTETFYTTSSRVGSLIFECEGSKKMYDGSYSQVEVIGWRPIETHINK